jgi:hypothetical protein
MDCTDEYRRIDVRRWQRAGLLKPGQAFSTSWAGSEAVLINVRIQIDRVMLSGSGGEYAIGLDWTPCTYGGQRAWFLCPAAGCGRRVATLYGGAIFACRHCYRLVYPSQRETAANTFSSASPLACRPTGSIFPASNPVVRGFYRRGVRRGVPPVEEYNASASESLASMARRFGINAEL